MFSGICCKGMRIQGIISTMQERRRQIDKKKCCPLYEGTRKKINSAPFFHTQHPSVGVYVAKGSKTERGFWIWSESPSYFRANLVVKNLWTWLRCYFLLALIALDESEMVLLQNRQSQY